MRVHLLQNRMTFEQADTLLYYLSSQKLVTGVKVREKTQDATINFVGDREEVIRALKVFHYETAKVPDPPCFFWESERFWKSGPIKNLWMIWQEACHCTYPEYG